jgi:glycerol-1-phosphate dehydrogenase [NAD(P)+]
MTGSPAARATDRPDTGDPVLDAMIAGRWRNPETGEVAAPIPFDDIRILGTTDGAEADLIGPLALGRRLAVVSDPRTHDAMGARVARALRAIATVDDVVVDFPEATDAAAAEVGERTRGADALIAVGSGTLQDLVKFATFRDGRPFATFATAASMNGYTSVTASITSAEGFKQSLRAHTPRGLFMDVGVASAAPAFLARSGLGDCLCRSTAQVDWRMSRDLLGTPYFELPFLIQTEDESALLAQAAGVGAGDPGAIRTLYRLLTWTGLGTCFTGTSHHGSMSEHLLSHWIDMFAGAAHPGTLHGHQVGYAAVAMSRLQHIVLMADDPPRLAPTRIDEAGMRARYGAALGAFCAGEMRGKAIDAAGARALNARMADWAAFRAPLRDVMLPTRVLEDALRAAGGFVTAQESGLPGPVWREAILHAREVRNRFTILDVAGDAGILEDFAAAEGARG